MFKNAFILNFLKLYNNLWTLAFPFLKKNKRLSQGFEKRIHTDHLKPADIWIQAASAGEAYLAVQILKTLKPSSPVKILVTTITAQGKEILESLLTPSSLNPSIHLCIEWFVFDQPDIMDKAVQKISPKVVVLLETEIWPAMIDALKKKGAALAILNARLSKKSFKAYLLTRFLWKHLCPDVILATSERDRDRYAKLFENAFVDTMNNIKFETLLPDDAKIETQDPFAPFLPKDRPIVILASIRRQEEALGLQLIQNIKNSDQNPIIALFPRHMHRIRHWEKLLAKNHISFELRSEENLGPRHAEVIVWDKFGELANAYRYARVVFVGGTLKPLGGQNFLEPAFQGIPTVIGPYYDDFEWVGEDLFSNKHVYRENNSIAVGGRISQMLCLPDECDKNKKNIHTYLESKKGGAKKACEQISALLHGAGLGGY